MKSMKIFRNILILVFCACLHLSCQKKGGERSVPTGDLMIRIAELSIDPEFLEEYLAILKEESAASMRLEPGVICIYPIYMREDPAEIRLLEIYADTTAYQSHLRTPHFQKYKNATRDMVKSLRLVDMEAIDPGTMNQIFLKLGD